ncbi:unnamed protein product [Meloidogyne enterolobii]|uniref:Uncharacterized protein n=1 Tax=Meloidogyne enterolobii TaxID=390850 RepID=A0ACB0ZJH0_MELEN
MLVQNVVHTTLFFHIFGLALNRLRAVFFPLSYQNVWGKGKIEGSVLGYF